MTDNSEGSEPIKLTDEQRIEKEAIKYVIQETGYQVLPEHDHWKSVYIAGATAERERFSETRKDFHEMNKRLMDDIIKLNQQLKEERNKAIDDCIAKALNVLNKESTLRNFIRLELESLKADSK